MTGYERPDEDYQPLTWVRGYPIHATHLLVALHVLTTLVCTLVRIVAPGLPIYEFFDFSTGAVFQHLALWRVVTYAFVHPLDFNFLIGMLMLFQFGWEVERFLGRRAFLILYGALLFTTPVLLLITSIITQTNLVYGASSFAIHFGIFIAFAVIYPNVAIFFNLITKWVALVLLVFFSLELAQEIRTNPTMLMAFWASVLVAYLGVRYAGAGGGMAFLNNLRQSFPRKTSPVGVKPRLKPRRLVETGANTTASGSTPVRPNYSSGGELHDSIDPLLDKISKHGLASLTHGERAALERARVSLLRKDRGG